MQNSTGKNLILIPVMVILITTGCTTVKTDYKAVPYEAIPGDCLFYFTMLPEIIPDDNIDSSMKKLLKRTSRITGGYKEGSLYLLFNGRYPDSFVEKKISESELWIRDEKLGYYRNESSGLSLYFAENNYIFAALWREGSISPDPMRSILDGRNCSNNVQGMFESSKDMLFHLFSGNATELISRLPGKKIKPGNIKSIMLFLDNNEIADNDERSYLLKSILSFSSEKDAKRYSPVLKLTLLDLVRDKSSGITESSGSGMSVDLEGRVISISDILVSSESADDFFNKLLTGTVF